MKKTKVIVASLDEFGDEVEKIIKQFDTKEEAEKFVLEHEQEYTDNPEIYSIYVG